HDVPTTGSGSPKQYGSGVCVGRGSSVGRGVQVGVGSSIACTVSIRLSGVLVGSHWAVRGAGVTGSIVHTVHPRSAATARQRKKTSTGTDFTSSRTTWRLQHRQRPAWR